MWRKTDSHHRWNHHAWMGGARRGSNNNHQRRYVDLSRHVHSLVPARYDDVPSVIGASRITQRVGIFRNAKQSDVIQQVVQDQYYQQQPVDKNRKRQRNDDVDAIVRHAHEDNTDAFRWTHANWPASKVAVAPAPAPLTTRRRPESPDPWDDTIVATTSTNRCVDNDNHQHHVLFPDKLSLPETADRILAVMPKVTLRIDDSDTYATHVEAILRDAFRQQQQQMVPDDEQQDTVGINRSPIDGGFQQRDDNDSVDFSPDQSQQEQRNDDQLLYLNRSPLWERTPSRNLFD